jgi:hypothetical protein
MNTGREPNEPLGGLVFPKSNLLASVTLLYEAG